MRCAKFAGRRGAFGLTAACSLVVASVMNPAGSAEDNASSSLAAVYAQVKAATVEVLVNDRLSGTGWFATPDGTVMTAAHVIGAPGQRIEIRHATECRLEATVVAVDLGSDLALLRVRQRPDQGGAYLQLAESQPPPGEEVYLLGTPMGNHYVLLRGIMAREGSTFEHITRFGSYKDRYVAVATIAATTGPGTSGGPWFNRQGRVIGLQCGSTETAATSVGLSFVVPAGCIARFLKAPHSASTPVLGVAVDELWNQAADLLQRFPPRTDGLLITAVQDGTPADDAGLEPWHVITKVDGQNACLVDGFVRSIRAKQPGESIELTLLAPDGGGSRQVAVTLADLEATWSKK